MKTANPLPVDTENLEPLILESPQILIETIPQISAAICDLLDKHPDKVSFVWAHLKPILEQHNQSERCKPKDLKLPIPPEVPNRFVNYHDEWIEDNFAHLYDRNDPSVYDYLLAENKFTAKSSKKTKTLQRVLYKEFVARVNENYSSPKVKLFDGYQYYTKHVEGQEYGLHCRVSDSGKELVYLNENDLAKDLKYFYLGFIRHSPCNDLIAYGVDYAGNERYSILFKRKESDLLLKDAIQDCSDSAEFSNDGKYLYYILLDSCERAWQVRRRLIETSVDEVVYEESDEMFFLSFSKSSYGNLIFINSSAQITSETRYLDASDSKAPLKVIKERKSHVNYLVDADDKHFYFLTNELVRNNFIYRLLLEDLDGKNEVVIAHRDFVLIEAFQLRKNHIIVLERSNCLQNIRIMEKNSFEQYHYIQISEMVYSLWLGTVLEETEDLYKRNCFDSNILRYTFSSFIQPKQLFEYNMDSKTSVLIDEESISICNPSTPVTPIFGTSYGNASMSFGAGYDQSKYTQRRLYATGVDGTAIPLSLVYRKDLLRINGEPNPLLLYGYGAYGSCITPTFNSNRLSLLDRGFIYCIAHVRGGADLGNAWYVEGKLLNKPNTFYDFISAAEYLIKENYTSKDKLSIYGRSAGGLLIGAVLNMRPDLFKSALMEVPFVDAINTMFDSSIPWTAFEFEEWGDPRDREIYNVMKTYCPYSNIKPQEYPNILVVAGLNDPRVGFFEPVKFVAKLRKNKTDSNLLLLKIDDVGHSGNSGQYSNLTELAFEYAFLISTLQASYKPIDLESDEVDNKSRLSFMSLDIPAVPNTGGNRSAKKLYNWIYKFF